jgi:hypothetical protein
VLASGMPKPSNAGTAFSDLSLERAGASVVMRNIYASRYTVFLLRSPTGKARHSISGSFLRAKSLHLERPISGGLER